MTTSFLDLRGPATRANVLAVADLTALCSEYTRAERECFQRWCSLIDGHRRPDWEAVTASQSPLHDAALRLREWCLASSDAMAAAAQQRQALMGAQVKGELAVDAKLHGRHSAQFAAETKQRWNSARWAIICERDALTCGLGWPHRGEPVTVTTFYYDKEGNRVELVGASGIYSGAHDVFEVSHEVIVPALGHRRGDCSVYVQWRTTPGSDREPLAPADPAGDISLRVADAPRHRLPVPLQRWPGPADVGIAVPDLPVPPEALFDPGKEKLTRQSRNHGKGLQQATEQTRDLAAGFVEHARQSTAVQEALF